MTVGGGIYGESGAGQLAAGGGTLVNLETFGTSPNYPNFSINSGFTWQNAGTFYHSVGVFHIKRHVA